MSEQLPDPSLLSHVTKRRLNLPNHFAGPVYVEEVSIEGPVYILRVKAGDGGVHDITVEPGELQHALSGADEAPQSLARASS